MAGMQQHQQHYQALVHIFKMMRENEKLLSELAEMRLEDNVQKELGALSTKLAGARLTLEEDAQKVREMKAAAARDYQLAEGGLYTARSLSGSGPAPYNFSSARFFAETVNSFDRRLQQYQQNVEGVERAIKSADVEQYTPDGLQRAVRSLHDLFISVAAQVAVVHDEIEAVSDHLAEERKRRSAMMIGAR
eukprot:m51a1_g12944 putative nucleoporin p58 p45 (191) ;mRNA; f:37-954